MGQFWRAPKTILHIHDHCAVAVSTKLTKPPKRAFFLKSICPDVLNFVAKRVIAPAFKVVINPLKQISTSCCLGAGSSFSAFSSSAFRSW